MPTFPRLGGFFIAGNVYIITLRVSPEETKITITMEDVKLSSKNIEQWTLETVVRDWVERDGAFETDGMTTSEIYAHAVTLAEERGAKAGLLEGAINYALRKATKYIWENEDVDFSPAPAINYLLAILEHRLPDAYHNIDRWESEEPHDIPHLVLDYPNAVIFSVDAVSDGDEGFYEVDINDIRRGIKDINEFCASKPSADYTSEGTDDKYFKYTVHEVEGEPDRVRIVAEVLPFVDNDDEDEEDDWDSPDACGCD